MTAVPVGAEESEGKIEKGFCPTTCQTSRAYFPKISFDSIARKWHFFAPAMVDQPEPEGNERGADDDRPADITTRHFTFALSKSLPQA